MRKNSAFLVFLFLLGVFNYAQKIDSLNRVIKSQEKDAKAASYLNLANIYINQLEAKPAYDNASKTLSFTDDKLLKGKAYYIMGEANLLLNQTFEQIKNLNLASELLKGVNDSLAANAMYYAHRGYRKMGMFPEALAKGLEELEFRKTQLPPNRLITQVYQEIGYTYDRMGEFEKAIEWQKKSLVSASSMKDEKSMGRSFGLIGIGFDGLGIYDSAMYYNKKAIELFEKYDNQSGLNIWYSNLGNTYAKLGDWDNAEKYTRLSLLTAEQNHPKTYTLVNLGKILIERGKFSEAKKILDSALILGIEIEEKHILPEVYYRFHELELEQNNYENALSYYVKYKESEDELFNEDKAKQINEMSIQYETAEKEKQILVQKASLAEQELKIQRRGYTIWGIGLLALATTLLGYLFWNQQKLKTHQLEKESELKSALSQIETQNRLQEQRLAISRDLHDNIGAQLTFIISSLDNLKYGMSSENVQLNEKINLIGEFTRDTINELRDTIWAMNHSEISFDDLRTRITNFIEKANLSKTKTSFVFNIDPDLNLSRKFNAIEGMNIYRIIQEAVNNATKYAQASKIEVLLSKRADKINFLIKDNGVGFDLPKIEEGNGISSMKKRAAELCSVLNIQSQEGMGTEISFSFNKNHLL